MSTKTYTREQLIDSLLAAIWSERSAAFAKLETLRVALHQDLGIRPTYVRRVRTYPMGLDEVLALVTEVLADSDSNLAVIHGYARPNAERHVAQVAEARQTIARCADEAAAGEVEFAARRWSRFFLVTSSGGGHIHSSMNCSTCRMTTAFSWLPELSGLTEADAVAAHGPLLCTVCYPTAPLAWTQGIEKPADPDKCPGSGTREHDSSGLRYYSPRAKCNHCHKTTSVTSTGKLRGHKAA